MPVYERELRLISVPKKEMDEIFKKSRDEQEKQI